MRCLDPGCECNRCSSCSRRHENCVCALVERTQQFLEADMDDYEAAAKARHLLQEWLDQEWLDAE